MLFIITIAWTLEDLLCETILWLIFNLPKHMRLSDMLIQADWHPLSYCYKLVLLKLVHKLKHFMMSSHKSYQIKKIVMKRPKGYSLQASLSNGALFHLFSCIYGKNSIAHRGPGIF